MVHLVMEIMMNMIDYANNYQTDGNAIDNESEDDYS